MPDFFPSGAPNCLTLAGNPREDVYWMHPAHEDESFVCFVMKKTQERE